MVRIIYNVVILTIPMNETSDNNTLPTIDKESFTCPHCSIIAQQHWTDDLKLLNDFFQLISDRSDTYAVNYNPHRALIFKDVFEDHRKNLLPRYTQIVNRGFIFSKCSHCNQHSVWQGKEMIYPLKSSMPLPNEDMPEGAKEIYEEARQVEPSSSRAAAALLRVCLEKITEHLGETTGNLYTRIKNLKKQGLDDRVINSLNAVRIIANEGGAHAGQIDLDGEDNKDIVFRLFKLVNYIVSRMISDPNEADSIFDALPENKKEGIKKRDEDSK